MTIMDKAGPIEVWLSQRNIKVECRVVHEDESTETLDVDSLSMRGAQREISGYLVQAGYKPEARWESEVEDNEHQAECWRRFRVVK